MLHVLHTFTHAANKREYSDCFVAEDEGEVIAAINADCMGIGGIFDTLGMDPNRPGKPALKQAISSRSLG